MTRALRLLVVTPSFHPAARYGGPTETTWTLVRALGARGIEVRVVTTNAHFEETLDVPTGVERELAPGVRVTYLARALSESFAPALLPTLAARMRWADVVQLGAVYNATTFPALVLARAHRRPLVWIPFGAHYHAERGVDVRKPHLKRAWDRAAHALLDPRRSVVAAASVIEAEASTRRLPGVAVEVVPAGVEVPPLARPPRAPGPPRLLFVGRLHPIKGLERLLDALTTSDASLTVAGSGAPAYEASLRAHARALGARVRFVGQVDATHRDTLFASHDLLVLPSIRESFGVVVAEALAHGLPALVTRPTAWEHLAREEAGLVVEPEALADTLAHLEPSALAAKSARAHALAARTLSVDATAERMIGLYERFRGDRP